MTCDKGDESEGVSAFEELFPLNKKDAWASVLNNLEEGLAPPQSQNVEGSTDTLASASKKIQKKVKKSNSQKPKKGKKKITKESDQNVIIPKSPERSSEYLNKIQLIAKHFYYPIKAKQDKVVANAFDKLLQEAFSKYQIDQIALNHYLLVKRFKMLFFKTEFAQHGFNGKYTREFLDVFMKYDQHNESNSQFIRNCLAILKIHFEQIGWDPEYVEKYYEKMRLTSHEHARNREVIIQNYLIFKKFKKIFKNENSKNGEDLSNYLRYEIFVSLFEPLCQEYKIDLESAEVYLVSEIKGGKEGVSKNGKKKGQAKISEKKDLERLLCPTPTDSAELIGIKAGSRLAFEIFFVEGFYERWVRKIYKKLQGSGNKIKGVNAKEVAEFLIQKKENIYREFSPQFPLFHGDDQNLLLNS